MCVNKPAGADSEQNWGPLVELPWGELMLGHEIYPYGAPEFPEPHFDLECVMYLPWVLDEPIDGAEE